MTMPLQSAKTYDRALSGPDRTKKLESPDKPGVGFGYDRVGGLSGTETTEKPLNRFDHRAFKVEFLGHRCGKLNSMPHAKTGGATVTQIRIPPPPADNMHCCYPR